MLRILSLHAFILLVMLLIGKFEFYMQATDTFLTFNFYLTTIKRNAVITVPRRLLT